MPRTTPCWPPARKPAASHEEADLHDKNSLGQVEKGIDERDSEEDLVEMLEEMWPIALGRLKKITEAHAAV